MNGSNFNRPPQPQQPQQLGDFMPQQYPAAEGWGPQMNQPNQGPGQGYPGTSETSNFRADAAQGYDMYGRPINQPQAPGAQLHGQYGAPNPNNAPQQPGTFGEQVVPQAPQGPNAPQFPQDGQHRPMAPQPPQPGQRREQVRDPQGYFGPLSPGQVVSPGMSEPEKTAALQAFLRLEPGKPAVMHLAGFGLSEVTVRGMNKIGEDQEERVYSVKPASHPIATPVPRPQSGLQRPPQPSSPKQAPMAPRPPQPPAAPRPQQPMPYPEQPAPTYSFGPRGSEAANAALDEQAARDASRTTQPVERPVTGTFGTGRPPERRWSRSGPDAFFEDPLGNSQQVNNGAVLGGGDQINSTNQTSEQSDRFAIEDDAPAPTSEPVKPVQQERKPEEEPTRNFTGYGPGVQLRGAVTVGPQAALNALNKGGQVNRAPETAPVQPETEQEEAAEAPAAYQPVEVDPLAGLKAPEPLDIDTTAARPRYQGRTIHE